MNPIICKQKTLLGVALALALLLASVAVAHATLFGRWPDLNMTYRFDPSCTLAYRHDPIMQGVAAWQKWLPGSSWTEDPGDNSSARVIFICYDDLVIPNSGNVLGTALCYPAGPFDTSIQLWTFSYCNVEFANGTFVSPEPARNIATHELGHALGLIDKTGGLMDLSGPSDPELGIIMPTQAQIDELCTMYGLVPYTLPQPAEVVTTTTTVASTNETQTLSTTTTETSTTETSETLTESITTTSTNSTASSTLPPHPGLSAVWDTRDLTYRISGCDPTFVPVIRQGLENWQSWLPEVTFREVTQSEHISFECSLKLSSGNLAEAEGVTVGGVFTHVTIRLSVYAFARLNDPQGGVNIVDHELGHAFGFSDGAGGLMSIGDMHYADLATVVSPTSEQLTMLSSYYSQLPQPIQTATSTTTDSTAPETSQTQTPSVTTPANSGTTAQSPPRCIIATAAYGSEMAPDVIYMRYVRDHLIGSTPIGHVLRDDWNTFYYSWSPPVAQAISTSTTLQALFRVLLQPLLVIIRMAAMIFNALTWAPDLASVLAFSAAAIVSTLDYIVTPACLIILAVRRGRPLR